MKLRRNYAGTLRAGRLTTRGCREVRIDKNGDVVSELWNPTARLYANLGDRLVISNACLSVDEVAGAEVVAMFPSGEPGVRVIVGSVADGKVHVMKSRKARVTWTPR